MGLISFFSGAAIATFLAFVLSKRSTRKLNNAIKSESLVTAKVPEDQLERFMDALDLLPIGIVIVDLKQDRRVRNNAAAAMTGVRYVDILVDQAVDAMIDEIKIAKSGKRILEAVAGTTRYFKISGQSMDDQRGIVTVEDITEKSRIDTVQTDFVANLSHELKTPIGAVAALADSLNGETQTEVVWRLAERIVTESHRMSRIVDDLLDLSRVEFGGTEEWTDIDLAAVLVEVVSTNQYAAKRQGLGLSLTGSSELLVRGDRSQLVSVFSNLVDNAIKYSEIGGVVNVNSTVKDDEIVLSVTDYGIGIAERDQKRIFERFYRVDKARSRATGGTGLGLSIVRHIVLEHGGAIDVRSEEGVGSTFTVRLPRVVVKTKELEKNQMGVMA